MFLLQAAAETVEKTSGTSDLQIALVGLGGVLVGALIGLLGIWVQSRAAGRSAYRQELRSHYADFMAQWEIMERVGTKTG